MSNYPNVQDVRGGKVHLGSRVGGALWPSCRWARYGVTYRQVQADPTCKDCQALDAKAKAKANRRSVITNDDG